MFKGNRVVFLRLFFRSCSSKKSETANWTAFLTPKSHNLSDVRFSLQSDVFVVPKMTAFCTHEAASGEWVNQAVQQSLLLRSFSGWAMWCPKLWLRENHESLFFGIRRSPRSPLTMIIVGLWIADDFWAREGTGGICPFNNLLRRCFLASGPGIAVLIHFKTIVSFITIHQYLLRNYSKPCLVIRILPSLSWLQEECVDTVNPCLGKGHFREHSDFFAEMPMLKEIVWVYMSGVR